MTARGILERGLASFGIPADEASLDAMLRYAELLDMGNHVMNLTAITAPEDVARLHFLDAAALLGAADFRAARVVDVGTGAGFPGVPLRILMPDMRLTLLDSLGKRVEFLRGACREMGWPVRAEEAPEGEEPVRARSGPQVKIPLSGQALPADRKTARSAGAAGGAVRCVNARAEEFARFPGERDGYDIAVSRAVADLRVLLELCLPLVRPGGLFLAMKAAGCGDELNAAGRAVTLLGGRLRPLFEYRIPETDILRCIVAVEKIGPTPEKYPRRFAKIQKAPL
ncbi:MAG TPA: 16S rRNA (guanine(527)-N(7))-methyltransferase RsmG [Oscillospiraceae bacterium]|nr:16S rRNA (guanine(527)-N(7))-methyltransferase RsmG [Oscillospiraceae bacterium]